MSNMYDDLNISVDYFVDRKCLPTWELKENSIKFHDLLIVLSGKATYIVNGKTYNLSQGDIVYAPKNSLRQAYSDSDNPMHCYCINFQCHDAENAELFELSLPTKTNMQNNSGLLGLCRELNAVWLEKAPNYHIKAKALFMLILYDILKYVHFMEKKPIISRRMEKVKEHILNHYQQEIDIQRLAESIGMNTSYLGVQFKKYTGCSIKEYANQIRIRNADDLLSTGGYSVSEAASRCGFDDIFYFSKVFKKVIGVPPSKRMK